MRPTPGDTGASDGWRAGVDEDATESLKLEGVLDGGVSGPLGPATAALPAPGDGTETAGMAVTLMRKSPVKMGCSNSACFLPLNGP